MNGTILQKENDDVELSTTGSLMLFSSSSSKKREIGEIKVTKLLPNINDDDNMTLWPKSSSIERMIESIVVVAPNAISRSKTSTTTRMIRDLFGVSDEESYWQTSLRWALLEKFHLVQLPNVRYQLHQHQQQESNNNVVHQPFRKLVFTPQEEKEINRIWNDTILQLAVQKSPLPNDLMELIMTKGKSSNQRSLIWGSIECGPSCRFKLHAHPNLEAIFVVQGELHEIRMNGTPLCISNDDNCLDEKENNNNGVDSSSTNRQQRDCYETNMSYLNRSWSFYTISQGEWLINEVGSVHQSFTSTNGSGCHLLLLWSGAHADIEVEPMTPSIEGAVSTMDNRIQQQQCACGNVERLQETFLPESEKSRRP